MREKWALRMAELTRPGGLLFTLIFPVTKHEGGPPFAVAVEECDALSLSSIFLFSDFRTAWNAFLPK
jgi:hypothetical protein